MCPNLSEMVSLPPSSEGVSANPETISDSDYQFHEVEHYFL